MKEYDSSLKRAVKIALRSPQKRFMTGSILLTKDGHEIAGWSHKSNVRLHNLESVHAEIHALGRGRHMNLEGATAYIATVARKSGNITNSRPCLTCAIALNSVGIKTAIYTIDNATYGVLDLTEDLSGLKVYKPHRN